MNLSDLLKANPHHFIGSIFTVVCTIIYHQIVQVFGLSPSGAILVALVVIAGYFGGLLPSLITAIWVTGYLYFFIDSSQIDRVIQTFIGTLVIASFIGLAHRRALINSNATKFISAIHLNRTLLVRLEKSDKLGYEIALSVNDLLTDIGTWVWGWKTMKREADQIAHKYQSRQ